MTFRENKPIYIQIAEQLMDKIERGDYNAYERIPSVREYAAGAGVNPNTVMRSYDWLEQSGMIYNKRGIGFFVADDAAQIITKARREEFFKNELNQFLEKLNTYKITPEELKSLYKDFLMHKS